MADTLTAGQEDEIFHELFDTFLGQGAFDECLRKAELLSGTLDKKENLKHLLSLAEGRKTDLPISGLKVKTESVFDDVYGCPTLRSHHGTSPSPDPTSPGSGAAGLKIPREVKLTPEEKWRLEAEGYDITMFKKHITTQEERALKKIRRKIKNKISAQESRRKKKEYVEGLERRVDMFSSVNEDLRGKLSELEAINRALQDKIVFLTNQQQRSSSRLRNSTAISTQTET